MQGAIYTVLQTNEDWHCQRPATHTCLVPVSLMQPIHVNSISSQADLESTASCMHALSISLCCAQLQYAAKRGFYFSTPKPGAGAKEKEVPPLPKDFIQVDSLRSRTNVTCTTHKLNALNARLSDAATDCLVLTEQVSPPRSTSREVLPFLPRNA